MSVSAPPTTGVDLRKPDTRKLAKAFGVSIITIEVALEPPSVPVVSEQFEMRLSACNVAEDARRLVDDKQWSSEETAAARDKLSELITNELKPPNITSKRLVQLHNCAVLAKDKIAIFRRAAHLPEFQQQ